MRVRFVGLSIHPTLRCGDGEGWLTEGPILFSMLISVVKIQAEARAATNEGPEEMWF
jgi:hypothetical protein